MPELQAGEAGKSGMRQGNSRSKRHQCQIMGGKKVTVGKMLLVILLEMERSSELKNKMTVILRLRSGRQVLGALGRGVLKELNNKRQH